MNSNCIYFSCPDSEGSEWAAKCQKQAARGRAATWTFSLWKNENPLGPTLNSEIITCLVFITSECQASNARSQTGDGYFCGNVDVFCVGDWFVRNHEVSGLKEKVEKICLGQEAEPLKYLEGAVNDMEKIRPSSVVSNWLHGHFENSRVVVILEEVCRRKFSKRRLQPRTSKVSA